MLTPNTNCPRLVLAENCSIKWKIESTHFAFMPSDFYYISFVTSYTHSSLIIHREMLPPALAFFIRKKENYKIL
jgi:hypothetical protein